MRKLLYKTLLILSMVGGSSALANECREYTDDQKAILRLSYSVGEPYDLGYTLASIVVQESFVGPYIVRINPSDGGYGSYGLGHVLLDWAMTYEGVDSSWEGKEILIPKLLTDDVYALNMALNHLLSNSHKGWKDMVISYNGSYTYYNRVVPILRDLQKCLHIKKRG